MGGRIKNGLSRLPDRYTVLCLLLALVILTGTGVGNGAAVSALGLLLCGAGMLRPAGEADGWSLLLLAAYGLLGMLSSVRAGTGGSYGPGALLLFLLCLLLGGLNREERRDLRRLCVLWACAAAAACVGQFVFRSLADGTPWRASGFFSNPNAAGIFLVLGWFAFQRREPGEARNGSARLEPLLLAGLTLTLSLGSFLAMAAGILALAAKAGRGRAFAAGCRLLAKASLGVGLGILVYLAAARTSVPWMCLPVLAYGAVLSARWERVESFLRSRPGAALRLSALGILAAAAVVAVRPSAAATFSARLDMMKNGLRYLGVNPLLGVGPYQWRLLNLRDGDTYFNTWHIHCVPLHLAVELGWPAAAALTAAALRALRKSDNPSDRGVWTALLVHNLIDTSFFYTAIPAMALMTAPSFRKRSLPPALARTALGLTALLFACQLYLCARESVF